MERAVARLGKKSWAQVAEELNASGAGGAERTGKQVRARWVSSLDPVIRQGPWTAEEGRAYIARARPGRSRGVLGPRAFREAAPPIAETIRDAQQRLGNKWAEIAKLSRPRRRRSTGPRYPGARSHPRDVTPQVAGTDGQRRQELLVRARRHPPPRGRGILFLLFHQPLQKRRFDRQQH